MGNTFGQLIEKLRKEAKLSLRDVAEKSGLSHTYIRDLERGHRRDSNTPIRPTIDTIMRLADAYGYSHEELIRLAGGIITDSEPIYVYADPEGWIEKLAAEYKQKNGREMPEWKKKAILELVEANRPEDDEGLEEN